MRTPPGLSLILIGSGLYWLLSGRLISSFTVLFPGISQSLPAGPTFITIAGIASITIGLWIVNLDAEEFRQLTNSSHGYVFVLPVIFVALDLYSTLASLTIYPQAMELNPFVSSAIMYGSVAVFTFFISYLALSEGLAILMLRTGSWLFGASKPIRFLPFALVCGVSSFGPFSNLTGLALGYETLPIYGVAATASGAVAVQIFCILSGKNWIKVGRLFAEGFA